jgi:hypothetical protein
MESIAAYFCTYPPKTKNIKNFAATAAAALPLSCREGVGGFCVIFMFFVLGGYVQKNAAIVVHYYF